MGDRMAMKGADEGTEFLVVKIPTAGCEDEIPEGNSVDNVNDVFEWEVTKTTSTNSW